MLTRRLIGCGIVCGALCLTGGLAACEHKVETVKTTETPNGEKVEKQTTVQHDDGTVTKTDEKSETKTETH